MKFLSDKRKRKRFVTASVVLLVFALIVSMCAIYLGDYYHADMDAIPYPSIEHLMIIPLFLSPRALNVD